jgi:hypothetical protein
LGGEAGCESLDRAKLDRLQAKGNLVNERAIVQLAKTVTSQYGLKECQPCVRELKRVFLRNGLHGKILKLATQGGRGLIVMAHPEVLIQFNVIMDTDISDNGNHYGVQVGLLVFDNIHKDGILRSKWVEQFDCDVHAFSVTTKEVF